MASSAGSPQFKLILVGESGVGKSSLFMRIKDNIFTNQITVGIDSCSTQVQVDDISVKLSVWDTAGVERFRTLTRNYYRNCHCVLLTCAFNDRSTLDSLGRWNQDAEFYAKHSLKVIVANKNDLTPEMTKQQLENFSSTYDCQLLSSVSAKTSDGIQEMLETVARLLLNRHFSQSHRLSTIPDPKLMTVDLNQSHASTLPKTEEAKCACQTL